MYVFDDDHCVIGSMARMTWIATHITKCIHRCLQGSLGHFFGFILVHYIGLNDSSKFTHISLQLIDQCLYIQHAL